MQAMILPLRMWGLDQKTGFCLLMLDSAGFWEAQVVLGRAAFRWCKPIWSYLELQLVLFCLIKVPAILVPCHCPSVLTGKGPRVSPTGCLMSQTALLRQELRESLIGMTTATREKRSPRICHKTQTPCSSPWSYPCSWAFPRGVWPWINWVLHSNDSTLVSLWRLLCAKHCARSFKDKYLIWPLQQFYKVDAMIIPILQWGRILKM